MTGLRRSYLAAHRLRRGGGKEKELVFGRSDGRALRADTLIERGRKVWSEAGLTPVGLHECRHTYAAFMIAAGVNAKALSSYMGHSTISMTLDRYGHLMPGNEDEAAAMLERYLERSNVATGSWHKGRRFESCPPGSLELHPTTRK